MSSSDIYIDLFLKLGYGYPLWCPSSDVHIGDVGFMSKGGFHRLFNAFEDKDHPLNKRNTLNEFTPFSYDTSKLRKRAIPEDHLCSRGTKISPVADLPGTYRVECPRNEKGAFLFFKDAVCEEILPHQELTKYIQANWKSWLHSESDPGVFESKDLIFVRGHIKTSDWALGTFAGVYSSVAVVQEKSGKDSSAYVVTNGSNTYEFRYGPTNRTASIVETDSGGPIRRDQCLFMRCCVIKRKLGVLWHEVAMVPNGRLRLLSPQEQKRYDADEIELNEIPAYGSTVNLLSNMG
ncbi:hypothetical protein BKA93DRAFT_753338 [Sparassis latifolia]